MSANPLAPAGLLVPADADALDAHVWPATATRGADGAIEVGGVSVTTLAKEFGTPLYVVDEADARGRAERALAAFRDAASAAGTTAHVYYAAKAFLSIDVARWMHEAGLRIDVASEGEMAVALAAGVPASELGFHGNNKAVPAVDRAVAAGIGTIVLDSRQELDRVATAAERRGVRQRVRIRVNSGVHAHTHEFLATAREDQKFGVPLADVPAFAAAVRERPGLDLVGLHSHIGSQIFDTAGFQEAARRLLAVHRGLLAGGDLPELNLGGGFGIAYTPADEPVDVAAFAPALVSLVAAECEALGIPVPAIAVEPGRSIIGPAGITLYSAGTVKDVVVAVDDAPGGTNAVRRYVSVDGGMSDNVRPALYGADYTVRLAGRMSAADQVLVRIAGMHCESGDIVVHADYLPEDAGAGDLLAVAATGAYCASLASNYNMVGRPPVVAVRDGAVRVLVRGETIDDLLGRDAGERGIRGGGS